MMDRAEVLRSIRFELFEYIQKRVMVNFDNFRQMPVSFTFNGRTYRVGELIGRFKTADERPINAYLVQASEEIFFLYFHYYSYDQRFPLHSGSWVLSFRIFNDNELMALYREDRKMLGNMALKRLVDFHGHLCPDLMIGTKLCEYVQGVLKSVDDPSGGIFIIAENSTSALDAIQVLLGATLGNQRLYILDFGKHNYSVYFKHDGKAIRLSMKPRGFGHEEEYEHLERKIRRNEATLDDVTKYQAFVDNRILQISGLSPELLFEIKEIEWNDPPVELASVYHRCSCCSEPVLEGRLIDQNGELYCIPCFTKINGDCVSCSAQ